MASLKKSTLGLVVLAALAATSFALLGPASAQKLGAEQCTVDSECSEGFVCKEAKCVEKEEEEAPQ